MQAALNEACGLPMTLSATGRVRREDFEAVGQRALNDGAMIVNPRQADLENVLELLERVW